MGRWIILGVVVAVALTVYAVVDCAMSDANRTRIFRKPIWLVIVLLLPVIGPLLWMFMGKGPLGKDQRAPDNDVDYLRSIGNDKAHDDRIAELEDEMRKLDDEIEQARRTSMNQHPSNHTGAVPTIDADGVTEAETSPSADGDPSTDSGTETDNSGTDHDSDSEGTRS